MAPLVDSNYCGLMSRTIINLILLVNIMGTIFIIICLIGIPYGLAFYIFESKKKIKSYDEFLIKERMPYDLQQGKLIFNETDIECLGPYPCRGRIDQGFLVENRFVPLDTKTRKRHRYYESDVIQLSLYAYIVYHRYRLAPACYGYVRTVVFHSTGKSVEYHYVKLYGFAYLEQNYLTKKDIYAAV